MAIRDIIMAAAGSSGPPPPPGPVSIASGTRTPTLGTGAQSPFPAAGWTALQSSSVDDASRFWSFGGVTFTINNTAYTGAYVGSNQYVTFGSGSSAYSSLSASNPPYNKIHVCGADNSMQRVSYRNYTGFSRLRMEGRAATSGTPGSPNIVWEMTFVDPSLTPAGVQYVEVLVGTQLRTTGQGGVASTNAFYVNTARLAANTSYVFTGNATGTSWTASVGAHLDGVPY